MRHHLMARFWWILALRGTVGILLGLISACWLIYLNQATPDIFSMSLFLRPVALIATLVLLLGAYALLDGIFAILLGVQDYGEGKHWWSLILEGSLSVGLGLLTWFKPDPAILALLYWVAAWAIFTGLLEILQGFELTEYRERKKPFLFAGFCSVVFGFLVYGLRMGGQSLIWLVGAYAFFFSLPLLRLALRLRPFAKAHPGAKRHAT